MYLGAPFSAPSSMKSKSKTRFNEAIITTNKLNPMLNIDALVGLRNEKLIPKKLAIIAKTMNKKIPPVAATTPSLKFSVAFIRPDL